MASNNKYQIALKYGKNALKLHQRGLIPPYPKFYELFYTYSCGTHPELNERLNELFAKGENPNAEVIEALYDKFLNPSVVEERLAAAADMMADQINSVNQSIDTAITKNDAYSNVLQSAVDGLDIDADQQTLNAFAQQLIAETTSMQETNAMLEKKLAKAKEDVTLLKAEIDDVRRDSMLDPLTKIHNRKSFDLTITKSIKNAEESGEDLSLLMIDIDHFKQFNDNHGHQTGDQVLRLVAATLSSGVREVDLTARYGGEEFCIILPKSSLGDSVLIAEKLRHAVETRKLHKRSTNEDLGRITISIGVASFRSGDTDEMLIERADSALYAAKRAGRNKVVDENSELLINKEENAA